VLQWLGDRWEVRVRAPNGDVVVYDPKTTHPSILEGYTQQYICWTAAKRDESHLLEREPWVDPWA
jgi:hypothetical protein